MHIESPSPNLSPLAGERNMKGDAPIPGSLFYFPF